MTWPRWSVAALALLWAAVFAPSALCEEVDRIRRSVGLDRTSTHLPTPAVLTIWTDKPGYLQNTTPISVYLAKEGAPGRAGEQRLYREFIFLENIETGQRRYLLRRATPELRDEIIDVLGNRPQRQRGTGFGHLPPTKIWSGRSLEAGLWQFVVELRSLDTSEVIKRAHAKFVVSAATSPTVLGADGSATEIHTDTTWTNDRIYALQDQVFVNPGATLSIEPGTLILGRAPQAAIVVERGGRIEARGRPDAPVVMTCDAPLGQREAGCWGGLVVLGNAPTTRGTTEAAGIVPEERSLYGGDDPLDSSGHLQYVRVEFAGADTATGAGAAGLALYGVGAGTLIDHVQVHMSAADGILFAGGNTNCTYCTTSGAADNALAWNLGWQGTAQHVFLQMNPAGGASAIAGGNDSAAFDAMPRSAPTLYNLTLVGNLSQAAASGSLGAGIVLHSGSAVTARNMIVTGFPVGAIDARDNSPSLFINGTSSIANAILHANSNPSAEGQVIAELAPVITFQDERPRLVNMAYRANPDPRPLLYSPALFVGAAAVPRSDGILDTSAQYVGAFGDSNWLAEWTFFGPESDYDTRSEEDREDPQ